MEDINNFGYSTHLTYFNNIEAGRTQILGNCWAHAVASSIGDILSIKYNLQPVYPSTIWITSIRHLLTKIDIYLSGDDYGFYGQVVTNYMKENEIPVKLESCFDEEETIKKLCEENDIEYDRNDLLHIERHLKMYYLGYGPNCCIWNKSGNICKFDYTKETDIIDKFDYEDGNIYVKDIIIFDQDFEDVKTLQDIQKVQTLLKYFIWCNKLAISTMICTEEYIEQLEENILFIQKGSILGETSLHQIVILGWGKDEKSGIEFWYIRDSNIPFIKKVAFTTRLDRCIGIDILFSDNNLFNIYENGKLEKIFSIDVDIDSKNLDNLLTLGIIKKV